MEEDVATLSSILAWRIPWLKSLAGCSPWGHTELDMTEVTLCAHKAERRGWIGEHHHPTSEGFKDLSPWGGQEEKRTEARTHSEVGRGRTEPTGALKGWTKGAKEENLSQERGLFNCIESFREIKENDGRQENVRSANVVTPVLDKDRLRRQDVAEVLLVKRNREVEWQLQSDEGVKGSLFTLKDV